MALSTLAKKLQLKTNKALIVNAPPGYVDILGIEADTYTINRPYASLDFIQIFIKESRELESLIPSTSRALKFDGLFWVSYPKGTSKVKTDLKRDILNAAMKKYGFTGVSIISVDDTWSAMRFRPTEKDK